MLGARSNADQSASGNQETNGVQRISELSLHVMASACKACAHAVEKPLIHTRAEALLSRRLERRDREFRQFRFMIRHLLMNPRNPRFNTVLRVQLNYAS